MYLRHCSTKLLCLAVTICSLSSSGSRAAQSTASKFFGESGLAIFRVEPTKGNHATLKIVGCFPNDYGEGGRCTVENKAGEKLLVETFYNGLRLGPKTFTFRKHGPLKQFEMTIDRNALGPSIEKAGFVAAPQELSRYISAINDAKKSGAYRKLDVPQQAARSYDLDGDGIPEFLFLPPEEGYPDGKLMIHEPSQKDWIVFDNGCC